MHYIEKQSKSKKIKTPPLVNNVFFGILLSVAVAPGCVYWM